MLKNSLSLFLVILCTLSSFAQKSIENYVGIWKGVSATQHPFDFTISIHPEKDGNASFIFSGEKEILRKKILLKETLSIPLGKQLVFNGIMNSQKSEITGFIKLGYNFYPVQLYKKNGIFKGKWNLTAIPYLQPEALYLDVVQFDEPDEGYMAYPKLGPFWVMDLELKNDSISFRGYKTGLIFKGPLQATKMDLTVSIGGIVLSQISYHKTALKKIEVITKKENNVNLKDGWRQAKNQLALPQLEKDISDNKLEKVEGVVIAQHGKLRYENYFNGFTATTPHDTRSAGKSIGSAIIGLAIDDGIIESTEEYVYKYLPQAYQYTKDEQKAKIKLQDLLTMRSGIGVYENDYQDADDWLKMVLEAKLKDEPGTRTDYKSADAFLLSVYLKERLTYPLELYMQTKLFSPLGITNFILNTDDRGNPYFAGGMRLTPRDLLKFGQLYLNKGMWKGERIISEKWVEASIKTHTQLENPTTDYGYFWYNETYEINGKTVKTIEARGNGGQYICIIPSLDAVVVVTAGNYNIRRLYHQTENILKMYVLPTLIE